VLKALRDARLLCLLAVLAIVLFEVLFVRAIGEFAGDILDLWIKRPLLRNFIKALVGADVVNEASATTLATIGLAHPFLLAVSWAFILANGTRVIAGEIDRGTADLVLTLPISRSRYYVSASAAGALACVPVALAPICGIWIGGRLFPMWEPLQVQRMWIATANLYLLFIAIGGLTLCVSAFIPRRGPAVGLTLGALLVSFLINFLAQLWPAVQRAHVASLSVLEYYRPLSSVLNVAWPVSDIATLLVLAAVFWAGGLWRFRTRDIPAA
jgi:ABC-2 type transport system permease protein